VPDLTVELLPRLRGFRLPGLDLGEGFVYPNYPGASILNVPASVCRWLGVPEIAGEPLATEYSAHLGEGARRVILVLVDALGFQRLRRWLSQGLAPAWERLTGEGAFAPLTSVTPSTTSAALTSLWTGRGAAEHGITGYEMWLKEYGVVANTILHSPITFSGEAGSLSRAGFTPEAFMPLPTMGTYLKQFGIKTYAFQHQSIARSGLSRMFFKDVQLRAFNTAADLWVNVRQAIEAHPRQRQYLWVYWSEIDTFSHLYGPDDERTAEEFAGFSAAFERLFLKRLKSKALQDTILLLLADHGQIVCQPDSYYELRHHPNLLRRLHILPTGENRMAYLYIRPGQTEAVREYVERTWPRQFVFVDPGFAVNAGLWRAAPALAGQVRRCDGAGAR
jgi:predicted AlkP superfamily pyrophosphatase or phosphodiesterase